MKHSNVISRLMAASVVAMLLTVPSFSGASASHPDAMPGSRAVLKDFLRAMYSRDLERAYALLSKLDREEKSFDDYASEQGRFEGPALLLARTLADAIRFEELHATATENRTTIKVDAAIPNANDASIEEIVLGFDRDRLANLSAKQIDARRAALRRMVTQGRLPLLHAQNETWTLLREEDGWRVFLNWADAVEVRFEAVTLGGLDWHFVPLRDRIMARHGETIRMAYRAKNIGQAETTGKARHIVGPTDNARFMEIVSCFCFLKQTLAPGEEVELPLTFRVDYDAPEDVTRFTVRYEFYRADQFPGGQPPARADG